MDDQMFIDAIRVRPAIWNFKHPNHHKELAKATEEVAVLFGVTVKEVKDKYRNLRTYYVKEKKRVEASTRSGAGSDDVYAPTWKNFHSMKFLDDTLQLRPTISSIPQSQTSVDIDDTAEEPTPAAPTPPPPTPSPPLPTPTSSSTRASTPTEGGKRKASTAFKPAEEAVEVLKQMVSTRVSRDMFDHFGAAVAGQVRALPSHQMQSYAMMRVQQLLYDLLFPEPSNSAILQYEQLN